MKVGDLWYVSIRGKKTHRITHVDRDMRHEAGAHIEMSAGETACGDYADAGVVGGAILWCSVEHSSGQAPTCKRCAKRER